MKDELCKCSTMHIFKDGDGSCDINCDPSSKDFKNHKNKIVLFYKKKAINKY